MEVLMSHSFDLSKLYGNNVLVLDAKYYRYGII